MASRTAARWKCPTCGREFAKSKQYHSCQVHTVDEHFRGKDPERRQTYDVLVKRLREFGPVRVDAVKSMIHFFASKSCFGGVTVKKNHLRMGFVCDTEIKDERIMTTQRIGPNRVAHSVKLSSSTDVDKRLITLVKRAYTLQSR